MKFWILLFLSLITCRSAPAQGGARAVDGLLTPRVRSFQSGDYGAENQNWAITQSPDGVLYVANSGGVLIFDGRAWTVRRLPKRPTVRAVAWGGARLFVGGYGEFGYFPGGAGGQLGDYVSLSAGLPDSEQGEEIWHIEALADGSVVYQSFSRLYRWSPTAGLHIEQPGNLMFAHAAGDSLLIPVTGRGLLLQAAGTPPVLLPGSDPGGRAIVAVTGPAAAPLLATQDRLFRYHDGRLHAWSAESTACLAGQQINRLLSLRGGEVAVGTILGGLYLFAADGRLAYHLSFGDGLGNNTVLALFEDRNGDLWAGLDRGLDLIVRSEPLRYYRPGGQAIGAVYGATTYHGHFYVGTNQGLFVRKPGAANFSLIPGTAGQVWELRPTPTACSADTMRAPSWSRRAGPGCSPIAPGAGRRFPSRPIPAGYCRPTTRDSASWTPGRRARVRRLNSKGCSPPCASWPARGSGRSWPCTARGGPTASTSAVTGGASRPWIRLAVRS